MEYFLVFLAGMATSVLILRWAVQRAVDRFVDQLNILPDQSEESKSMEMRVEFDQDTYYCYNTQDNTFVCQGSNFEELQSNFRRRYPDINGVIVQGDEASATWLKTEIGKNEQQSLQP